MSVERKEFGDRGLGVYGDPVIDTYNMTEVMVSDSSAAMYSACWLRVKGEAHLRGDAEPFVGIPHGIAPADISAHLDLPRAKQIVAELQAWIDTHDDGDESNSKEGSDW